MAEDKACDRRESLDSGRERNAVTRPQGPDAARMDFFNGLLRVLEHNARPQGFRSLPVAPQERLSVIWRCAALYRILQVTTCLLALPVNAAPSKFPTRDSMRNPL